MLALLCGGQGLLSADMFDLVADRPEASDVFAAAMNLLGEDPRALVRVADRDRLAANRTSQILTVTASLAMHACIRDALPERFATTGYSVGEMASWSIAGIWPAKRALQLTDARARAMDAAAGGTNGRLGYIRGLRRQQVESLARQHDCEIAITNPGDLFVVGGKEPDIASLCAAALAAGAARTDLLAVRIAAHTPLLADAIAPFKQALDSATDSGPANNRILLSGSDGARVFSSATARLATQVASPIDWEAVLEAVCESGVDRVLDLGPGHALADMMLAAHPDIETRPTDAFRSIDGLRHWLSWG